MEGSGLAVEVLRASARGFAAMAANRMVVLDAKGAATIGGVAEWQQHLKWLLLELAVAVEDGAGELFEERVRWTRRGFEARGLDSRCLATALTALRQVFEEQLPAGPRLVVEPFLERAESLFDEDAEAGGVASSCTELGGLGPLVSRYLELAVCGQGLEAVELIREEVAAGALSLEEVLVRFVPVAMQEVGERWHVDRANVLQEHVATRTTQRLIDVLTHAAKSAPANGRTALVGMVAGDAHDMGCRALGALLELDGWCVVQAGADLPPEDFCAAADQLVPDLIVAGGTLTTHRPALRGLAPSLAAVCPAARIYLAGAAVRRWSVAEELGVAACLPELADVLANVRAAFPA